MVIQASVPKLLLEPRFLDHRAPFLSHYAVTADGQRFLISSIVEEAGPAPITVVVNWTAELKK